MRAVAICLFVLVLAILAGLWAAVNMDMTFLNDGIEDDEDDGDLVGDDA